MAFLSPAKILSAPTFLPTGHPLFRFPKMPQALQIKAIANKKDREVIILFIKITVLNPTHLLPLDTTRHRLHNYSLSG
jgi:hypothetical protein